MTLAEARTRYLDWLARERRAAANTVDAYGRDLADLLGFLAGHLGGEEALTVTGLAVLRPADLRGFLAARAAAGAGSATRARQLAAIRGFLRWLARAGEEKAVLSLAGLRGPRLKPPVPKATTARSATSKRNSRVCRSTRSTTPRTATIPAPSRSSAT